MLKIFAKSYYFYIIVESFISNIMKNLSLLSICAIAVISVVACKKDRVCECTTNGVTEKVTLVDATKRQGKANCVSYTEENGNGTSTKTECKLK